MRTRGRHGGREAGRQRERMVSGYNDKNEMKAGIKAGKEAEERIRKEGRNGEWQGNRDTGR